MKRWLGGAVLLCLLGLPAEADVPVPGGAAAPPPPAADEARPPRPPVDGFVRLQLQYDDGALGSRRAGNDRPARSGVSRYPAVDSLSIRRLQAQINAHLAPDLNFLVQGVYQGDGNALDLQRLALLYDVNRELQLIAGLQKVPFCHERMRSNGHLDTIERTDLSGALAQERDVALALDGRPDWGEWSLGLFQGQYRNDFGDPNGGKDVIGRVVLHPFEGFSLGVDGQLGTYTNSGQTLPVRRWGTDFRYQAAPWRLEGEYLWSDGMNYFSNRDTRASGYYLTVARETTEWLDLVAQFSWFDPDLRSLNAGYPDNGRNARSRTVVGLNFYLDRPANHRLMVDYEIHSEQEGPADANDGWRVQYQVETRF